jgi:hypothetical protein
VNFEPTFVYLDHVLPDFERWCGDHDPTPFAELRRVREVADDHHGQSPHEQHIQELPSVRSPMKMGI